MCSFARQRLTFASGSHVHPGFSPSDLYKSLEVVCLVNSPSSHVCLGLAPARVEVFCWLVILKRCQWQTILEEEV